MTLLIRLAVTLFFGAIVSFVAYKLLYTKPAYVGEYQVVNAKGMYKLRIQNNEKAILIYTDTESKQYAYLGDLRPAASNVFVVSWNQDHPGNDWQPMKKAVSEKLTLADDDTVIAPEGTFKKVHPPFWKKWFTL